MTRNLYSAQYVMQGLRTCKVVVDTNREPIMDVANLSRLQPKHSGKSPRLQSPNTTATKRPTNAALAPASVQGLEACEYSSDGDREHVETASTLPATCSNFLTPAVSVEAAYISTTYSTTSASVSRKIALRIDLRLAQLYRSS